MATRTAQRSEEATALADAMRSLPIVMGLTSVGLWLVLTLWPSVGADVTMMVVGYFALDLVSRFILRGGRGFAFSPLMDAFEGRRQVARPKGHAYLLYLAVIGVSAWALPSFAGALLDWGAGYIGLPLTRAVLAVTLAGAIGYSTNARFYRRP